MNYLKIGVLVDMLQLELGDSKEDASMKKAVSSYLRYLDKTKLMSESRLDKFAQISDVILERLKSFNKVNTKNLIIKCLKDEIDIGEINLMIVPVELLAFRNLIKSLSKYKSPKAIENEVRKYSRYLDEVLQ